MKARSAKNKGRQFQNYVRDKIQQIFGLSENDVKSAIMGETGMDIKLSDQARESFQYATECKSLARIAIYNHWKQATDNAEKEELIPLLVVKQNRSKPLAIIDFDHFMELIKANGSQHSNSNSS